jgi:SAM-dependent methyltransferase
MDIHELFYTNKFLDVAAFYKMIPGPEQVAFVEKFVPLRPGNKILDLACGFGRHSLLLAQKGYSVVGYDLSTDYIEKARTESERLEVEARFIQGDMRCLNASEEFDVVLSLQSSLTFYGDEVNRDIFCRIHRAMRTGATFVYDQANVFWLAACALRSEPTSEALPDGRIHHRTLSFDAETCVGSGRSILEKAGERDEAGWDMRFYTLPELKALTREIGFDIAGSYGGFDGSRHGVGSPRLIAVMKKA